MIVGILALVFYNDLMVKAWFAEINAPAQPLAPILPEPVPAPLDTPAVEPPAEPGAPAAPEVPAEGPVEPDSPRRPRKVA
jgi:hypothetical protein